MQASVGRGANAGEHTEIGRDAAHHGRAAYRLSGAHAIL